MPPSSIDETYNVMRAKYCLLAGALLGAIGVAAGALGAHALKDKHSADQLDLFEKAVRYLMYHALAIVAAGLIADCARRPSYAALLMSIGCLLFSGSLAAYSLTQIMPLVHIVPIGGVAYIVGWLLLAREGWRAASH